MESEKTKARKVLAAAISNQVLPKLEAMGFSRMEASRSSVAMWHLHRRRSDLGFDAITLVYDKKKRPLFEAVINKIERFGVRLPWGEIVDASHSTAITPLNRLCLRKKALSGSVGAISKWLGYGWFGFRPSENANENKVAARQACEEFINYLDQADNWWKTGERGPNLVEEKIVIPPSTPEGRNGSNRT